MIGVAFLVFLLFALAIPLLLWLAIDNETSNPTVVDRADAERLARERGGRGVSSRDADDRAGNAAADDADETEYWGTASDEHRGEDSWGTRADEDRNDRRP